MADAVAALEREPHLRRRDQLAQLFQARVQRAVVQHPGGGEVVGVGPAAHVRGPRDARDQLRWGAQIRHARVELDHSASPGSNDSASTFQRSESCP